MSLVILRGVEPGHEEYADRDVIQHLNEIDIENITNSLDCTFDDILSNGDNEIITKENVISKLIPQQMIHSRKISLDAIEEGLTLNGMF